MKEIEAKQTKEACSVIRDQCSILRVEKALGLGINIDLRFDQTIEKLDAMEKGIRLEIKNAILEAARNGK